MDLYNWAFKRWGFKKYFDAGATVTSLQVGKGASDKLEVVAAGKVGSIIPKGRNEGQDVIARLDLPSFLDAPVKQGQKIGQVVVLDKGNEVSRVDLLAKGSVKRASLWQQILRVVVSVFKLV